MSLPCWFCGTAPPVSGAEAQVLLRRGTEETRVPVPRCASCRKAHGKVNTIGCLIALAGMVAVFLIVAVWNPIDMPTWLKVVLTLFGAAPGGNLVAGKRGLPPGVKPEEGGGSYPDVLAAKKHGWVIPGETARDPNPR